ncbi:hypothetical protein ACOMHN_004863 [Nucella lapillus]
MAQRGSPFPIISGVRLKSTCKTTTNTTPADQHNLLDSHFPEIDMKRVFVALLLLTLSTVGQAAEGDVGSACKTGDACTDSGAYCDTTDSANKKCRCNTGFLKSDAMCSE